MGPDSQRMVLALGMACVGLERVNLRRDLFIDPPLKESRIFKPKKNYLFKDKCQKGRQR